MAPRAARAKGHKLRGGDKKKKEEKTLPTVLDISVKLPGDRQILLKGISTDRILDVRRLLAVHVASCHFTNYSLSHETRGGQLKESQEILSLKPCTLTLVEETYTREGAEAHVRRLLDIVSCTSAFGPSPETRMAAGGHLPAVSSPTNTDGALSTESPRAPEAPENVGSSEDEEGLGKAKDSEVAEKPGAAEAMAAAAAATERGDMTGMCPHESKLGEFYEFVSASHIAPPLHSIKMAAKQPSLERRAAGDFFCIDVHVCGGKTVTVTAGREGFSAGKQTITEMTLVALLHHFSRAFAQAYEDLLAFFLKRNKFGNTPYGFRSNTWLVPPPAAADPSNFPQLPCEDPTWGGSGGGQGRFGKSKSDSLACEVADRIWARDFRVLAKLPCSTPGERLTRDRKAFLLHSRFVDSSVALAAELVAARADAAAAAAAPGGEWIQVANGLAVWVGRDAPDACTRGNLRIEADPTEGLARSQLAERCLLKGITADESAAVHDTKALGTVLVRHRGFSVRVQVAPSEPSDEDSEDIEIEEQPLGGANALNPNSLRALLHSDPPPADDLTAAELALMSVVSTNRARLEDEEPQGDPMIRWELGACWVQHLQNPPTPKTGGAEKKGAEESGTAGTANGHLGTEVASGCDGAGAKETAGGEVECEAETVEEEEDEEKEAAAALKARLGEAAFKRLKETKTGLHTKSMEALLVEARKYYSEVALPKLVADFASLELSPVDGRTLTDFMHTRGLRMRSLGKVAAQSEKLPHVRSLCVHEMVTRAFKHLLRAAISSAACRAEIAPIIATCLNAMLGARAQGSGSGSAINSSPAGENTAPGLQGPTDVGHDKAAGCQVVGSGDMADTLREAVWRWVEMFVAKRFGWSLDDDSWHELRQLAVLRALCLKVGIEMVPRSYGMTSKRPFRSADVISLFPIYKHVACTSADGRTLLESSKAALDKGKLDEAVSFGTKALARLVAVCGPYHRMTAGAYSLLAVVLYHTGDFNQATIYQQKALDINERELGLDHPDTMKSYGDLAVFYYRLQHTELALKYVNRALYLLHLTCGPSHPNTAATYINVAMMEEGLGNVHLALRYLHEALKCNQRLLGPDHIQTAASYHAIAIALSLMEAFPLSVQHEETTLEILQAKLGPDDLRTQDAAAWLDYFDSKAAEQQEAARTGAPKPDASIASKGHLSVSDLLDFINEEEARSGQALDSSARKSRRPKTHLKELKGSPPSSPQPPTRGHQNGFLPSSQGTSSGSDDVSADSSDIEEAAPVVVSEEQDGPAAEGGSFAQEVSKTGSVIVGLTEAEDESEWLPARRAGAGSASRKGGFGGRRAHEGVHLFHPRSWGGERSIHPQQQGPNRANRIRANVAGRNTLAPAGEPNSSLKSEELPSAEGVTTQTVTVGRLPLQELNKPANQKGNSGRAQVVSSCFETSQAPEEDKGKDLPTGSVVQSLGSGEGLQAAEGQAAGIEGKQPVTQRSEAEVAVVTGTAPADKAVQIAAPMPALPMQGRENRSQKPNPETATSPNNKRALIVNHNSSNARISNSRDSSAADGPKSEDDGWQQCLPRGRAGPAGAHRRVAGAGSRASSLVAKAAAAQGVSAAGQRFRARHLEAAGEGKRTGNSSPTGGNTKAKANGVVPGGNSVAFGEKKNQSAIHDRPAGVIVEASSVSIMQDESSGHLPEEQLVTAAPSQEKSAASSTEAAEGDDNQAAVVTPSATVGKSAFTWKDVALGRAASPVLAGPAGTVATTGPSPALPAKPNTGGSKALIRPQPHLRLEAASSLSTANEGTPIPPAWARARASGGAKSAPPQHPSVHRDEKPLAVAPSVLAVPKVTSNQVVELEVIASCLEDGSVDKAPESAVVIPGASETNLSDEGSDVQAPVSGSDDLSKAAEVSVPSQMSPLVSTADADEEVPSKQADTVAEDADEDAQQVAAVVEPEEQGAGATKLSPGAAPFVPTGNVGIAVPHVRPMPPVPGKNGRPGGTPQAYAPMRPFNNMHHHHGSSGFAGTQMRGRQIAPHMGPYPHPMQPVPPHMVMMGLPPPGMRLPPPLYAMGMPMHSRGPFMTPPGYQGLLRPPVPSLSPPPLQIPVAVVGPGSIAGGQFPPLVPVPMNPDATEFVPAVIRTGCQSLPPEALEQPAEVQPAINPPASKTSGSLQPAEGGGEESTAAVWTGQGRASNLSPRSLIGQRMDPAAAEFVPGKVLESQIASAVSGPEDCAGSEIDATTPGVVSTSSESGGEESSDHEGTFMAASRQNNGVPTSTSFSGLPPLGTSPEHIHPPQPIVQVH